MAPHLGTVTFGLLGLCVSDVSATAPRQQLAERVERLRRELREAETQLAEMPEEESGLSLAPWAQPAVCNARLRTGDLREASEYLAKQHALRAPFYIEAARQSFQKGLKQLKGIDTSNSDPFIKQHEGQLQVLGALDLAPNDPQIWLEAAQVSVLLAALGESEGEAQHALAMFARAAQLDESTLPKALTWLSRKESEAKEEKQLRKAVRNEVKRWNQSGQVPEIPVTFVSTLREGICFGRSGSSWQHPEDVAKIVSNLQVRDVFPTKVLSVNVLELLPEGFTKRLSDLAIQKYQQFSKKFPKIDPNDLNDKFFSFQATNADRLGAGELRKWPEMYRDSEDFKILTRVMKGALRGFLERTHVPLPQAEDYGLVLWAAVYPGNGGRHGYHVHQGSASSCVLYARVAGASTPISFIDPRGAPPVEDYEQYEKERDFEPKAPFHHNEYFFPREGDLVCFPSWLVHNVPSHWESETRVAFAANLQGQGAWDSWFHTAVGWS
ncbi:unnamed protein product [Durusdinium trenchii]|uniref:Uncharacterized protein n=2 Tax=Durusdinium trenchii TaxID=1381693 RepID=A0ABP0PI73_9DINO